MSRTIAPCLLLLAVGLPAAAQPTYQVTPIPFLPGGTQAGARGVNNLGHVVGWCQAGGSTHAFLYTPSGGTIDLGSVGVTNPEYGAYAVNDADEVVGVYAVIGAQRAFRWAAGSFQNITINTTTQPVATGAAVAINNGGQIGGTLTFNCNPVSTPLSAAHWTAGGAAVAPLGTYDLCSASTVLGMNNVGDLVGWGMKVYSGLNWYRPTLWHAGMMIELPTLGTAPAHAYVYAINDAGVAVGWSENRDTPSIYTAPCLWTSAGIVNLNPPATPTAFAEPRSINNAGFIVGNRGASTGGAVLWTAPGSMYDLGTRTVPPQVPPSGIAFDQAGGISDTGFIVCTGMVPGTSIPRQGYLLAPCAPGIVSAPVSVSLVSPGPVGFSVMAVGAGPLSYQWRKGGIALVDGPAPGGGTIVGATTPALSITPAASADAGVYDCLVTTACGSGSSGSASLTVTCCSNCDGSSTPPLLTVNDFVCFLARYAAGDSWANCDGSSVAPVLNISDFTCFLARFAAGCP